MYIRVHFIVAGAKSVAFRTCDSCRASSAALYKENKMRFDYKTSGTCAKNISFDLTDGVITNIEFAGGCNGNLKAIATLVDGLTAEQVAAKLSGNTCGERSTSCADQLAQAVRHAVAKAQETA